MPATHRHILVALAVVMFALPGACRRAPLSAGGRHPGLLNRYRGGDAGADEGVSLRCTPGLLNGLEMSVYNGATFTIGVVHDNFVPSVYVNDDGSFSLVHGVTPERSTERDGRVVHRIDFIHPGERRVWRARVLSDALRQYEYGTVGLQMAVPESASAYCVLGWWRVQQDGGVYDVNRAVAAEEFLVSDPQMIR